MTSPTAKALEKARKFNKKWLSTIGSAPPSEVYASMDAKLAELLDSFAADARRDWEKHFWSQVITGDLECNHCGDIAFVTFRKGGIFIDGEGGHCLVCGMPGQVCADGENSAYWRVNDDNPQACCNRDDCEECTEGDTP